MMDHAPPDEASRAAIAGNVALVEDRLLPDAGIDPGDWAGAVTYLDGFIEGQRVRADAPDHGRLSDVLGAYFGHALIGAHGGRWIRDDSGIGVEVGGVIAYPFHKVAKQFEHGAEESIEAMFRSLPVLVKEHRDGRG